MRVLTPPRAERLAPVSSPVERITLPGAVDDRLYFAQVREDPLLEMEALNPAADDSLVVVGSGGCTALSLLSMGESWHHNHHTFPRSAFHGLRGWERHLDPTGWVIRGMRRVKLAWNVVEITPERQQQKLAT